MGSDFILIQSTRVFRVQSPASSVQSPEPSVQSPASNSWVQSPGIPVYGSNRLSSFIDFHCQETDTFGSIQM